MAAAKRPALPVILLANDLLDGDVVFAAGDANGLHWTRDPGAARREQFDVAHDALPMIPCGRIASTTTMSANVSTSEYVGA